MNLARMHSVFDAAHKLNEIELINHVHALRAQTKKSGLTGVLTYRAGMFALHAEGQKSKVEYFSEFLAKYYSVKYTDITGIVSRKFSGLNLSYVGNDAPIVNEPVLDWAIENPTVVFPEELTRKILEINRESN